VDGAAALLRHGFAPYAAIAIRAASRADASASAAPGVAIRRATPDDLGTFVDLGLGVVRFDAYFGGVRERPWTAAALREQFAAMLAVPRPWMWLAERDGDAVGMPAAEHPGQAEWIAPRTRSGAPATRSA
jgi:hypothetical protein